MKTLYKHILVLFILCAFNVFNLTAQVPPFKNIKVLKGKNNYSVRTIYQDKTGYLWFGTNLGLVRFDGINNILFNQKDSLADDIVTALCEDKQNQLWIGHKNGKITIHSKQTGFVRFDPEEGIGDKEISSIVVDSSGTVWFSTLGEGIYYYKNKRLYNVNVDDGLLDNYCYCLSIDNKQNVWVGTDAGISIYTLKNKSIESISMKDGLPDNIVKSIVFSEKGSAWIGMEEGGITNYNTIKKIFTPLTDWKFGSISSMVFGDKQNLWIAAPNTGLVNVDLSKPNINFQVYIL